MTQVIAKNINNVFRYRESIFVFLVIGILICTISYVSLLHSAIANVVEREAITKEARLLGTAVSELESNYFSVKDSINIELAHEKGFKDSEISSFISKKSLTAMVNHNEL